MSFYPEKMQDAVLNKKTNKGSILLIHLKICDENKTLACWLNDSFGFMYQCWDQNISGCERRSSSPEVLTGRQRGRQDHWRTPSPQTSEDHCFGEGLWTTVIKYVTSVVLYRSPDTLWFLSLCCRSDRVLIHHSRSETLQRISSSQTSSRTISLTDCYWWRGRKHRVEH